MRDPHKALTFLAPKPYLTLKALEEADHVDEAVHSYHAYPPANKILQNYESIEFLA